MRRARVDPRTVQSLAPVLCEGTRTQHESSQEPGHQQGQVQRGTEDEHGLLLHEPESECKPYHGDGGRETGKKHERAVGHNGMGKDQDTEWLIKDMSNELKVWGAHGGTAGNIILKTDGEPAILAVRDAPAKYHGGIVVQEGAAVGESQSNGVVEEAGKMVREFVRVLKEQIEGKTNVKLECDDVIISRYMVGKDGRTSCERRRDRVCRAPVATFGEKIWCKQIREQKKRKDKI